MPLACKSLLQYDLALQNGIEVDKRLKNADFGPDDTTEDSFNDDIEAHLSKSAEASEVKHDFPQEIIKIRQDVLGVDRENIMKNVLRKCKESKGLHRLEDDPTPPSYTSYQPEITKLNLPNFPVHSRTHEIKKWATQFKKDRKSLSKRQKYAEEKELLSVLEEGDEDEEDSDHDTEIEDDFDENFHDENYNPDNRF
ncbi:hypothetical protein Avbf_09345 [Armadillidium vulgare]|nr:hypothetical protein Avbf_09345 [Armadillidium vulgare]